MILNRQNAVRIPVSDLQRFLGRVQRKLHITSSALTVCLVSNAQIARWNRDLRRKRGPTDVLSFPADEGSEKRQRNGAAPDSYLGDIAIAPAVARQNARRFGRTFTDELRILILHGALHLMGYDHETDHGEMDQLEERLRRALGLAWP
jgi:probable rRNA maturation factor